jgi:serine/threonine-protein kinase
MLKISPNDSYIAYVATAGGEDEQQLYLHSMETNSDEAVPGSVGAHSPFFSPDEEWLGFFSRQNTLMKIPVKGGVAPVPVTDVVNPFGATWTDNHRIVVGSFGSVLHVVREEGGVAEVLTRLTPGDGAQRWPFSLPGGRALLFKTDSGIVAQQLGEPDRRSLITGTAEGILPQYSPSGHLVYVHTGNLMATPFDPAHLQVKGGVPTKVMSGVLQAWGVAHFSLSVRGALVYVPGEVQPGRSNLVRVSRSGTIERTFGDPGLYNQPRAAPDGRRVAVDVHDDESRLWEVWLGDLRANELNQFTYKTDGDNRHGTFVGSNQLVVQSDRNRTRQLFLLSTDGGAVQQLTDFRAREDLDVYTFPVSFCGDVLTFVRLVPNGEGWVLHIGDSSGRGRTERLDFPMVGDGVPSLSPDCKWLAYVSDESGDREVWVRPFPPTLGKGQQISKGGGNEPVWNPDRSKREIFYRDGQSLMAARISDQGSLAGKAETLFPDSYLPVANFAWSRPNYDVFPDGSFLMLKPAEQKLPVTQINVVLNWSEELKRLVPTTK